VPFILPHELPAALLRPEHGKCRPPRCGTQRPALSISGRIPAPQPKGSPVNRHRCPVCDCQEISKKGANDRAAGFKGIHAATASRRDAKLSRPETHAQNRITADSADAGGQLDIVAKAFSEQPRSETEIEVYAGDLADMFCAYVESL
jgi:hypothetical protein